MEEGAKVGANDACGQTALIHAAANGSSSVVYLLLQNGADTRAEDSMGRTALSWAKLGRDPGHSMTRETLRRFKKDARGSSGSQKKKASVAKG